MSGQQVAVYASAARTATPTAFVITPRTANRCRVIVDVTAIVSTPSITVTIDVFDLLANKWVNVVTSSAITTVSTNVLTLVEGIASNVRVTVTHGNANSITYSVSAHMAR